MSKNQHKCKLTGVELKREFLEVLKFNWKDSYKNPDEIMVDISEGELPPFYVSFGEFAKYGNIYWNALKEYPIDITQFTFDNIKNYDVVLYADEGYVGTWWSNIEQNKLEEAILQAVVTYHNYIKQKEEQT